MCWLCAYTYIGVLRLKCTYQGSHVAILVREQPSDVHATASVTSRMMEYLLMKNIAFMILQRFGQMKATCVAVGEYYERKSNTKSEKIRTSSGNVEMISAN